MKREENRRKKKPLYLKSICAIITCCLLAACGSSDNVTSKDTDSTSKAAVSSKDSTESTTKATQVTTQAPSDISYFSEDDIKRAFNQQYSSLEYKGYEVILSKTDEERYEATIQVTGTDPYADYLFDGTVLSQKYDQGWHMDECRLTYNSFFMHDLAEEDILSVITNPTTDHYQSFIKEKREDYDDNYSNLIFNKESALIQYDWNRIEGDEYADNYKTLQVTLSFVPFEGWDLNDYSTKTFLVLKEGMKMVEGHHTQTNGGSNYLDIRNVDIDNKTMEISLNDSVYYDFHYELLPDLPDSVRFVASDPVYADIFIIDQFGEKKSTINTSTFVVRVRAKDSIEIQIQRTIGKRFVKDKFIPQA